MGGIKSGEEEAGDDSVGNSLPASGKKVSSGYSTNMKDCR